MLAALLQSVCCVFRSTILYSEDCSDDRDVVSGQTALHCALFAGALDVALLLAAAGASPHVCDEYDGTPFDYASMLTWTPQSTAVVPRQFWLRSKGATAARQVDVEELQTHFRINYCPLSRIDLHYVYELMFSGLKIDQRDQTFRSRYGERMWHAAESDALIIVYIDDVVGYGLFANRTIEKDEYLCRYGALVRICL